MHGTYITTCYYFLSLKHLNLINYLHSRPNFHTAEISRKTTFGLYLLTAGFIGGSNAP